MIKVAIVGVSGFRPSDSRLTSQATGRIGSNFAEELVKTGQHTVTAVATR